MRMRGPLSGANMTSNSVGLLFYSVLSTFLPAKVMIFDILILLRMKDMMDLMDLMDMMDTVVVTYIFPLEVSHQILFSKNVP